MNELEQYITSGILELYVAGALNEQESREVTAMCHKHPEVAKEVHHIEQAVRVLAASMSPGAAKDSPIIVPTAKIRPLWPTYLGWAAAGITAVGLVYMFNQNSGLENQLTDVEDQKQTIEYELQESKSSQLATQSILDALRDKNTTKILLPGQGDHTDAYAAVYWNQEEQKLYVDMNGLPSPPEGKQYQLWSLKLSPLTPTSLGVMDTTTMDLNLYVVDNPNDSEAFGITLEPAGGSPTPTLEQLYVLGTVTP